jgi:hypothetical protein
VEPQAARDLDARGPGRVADQAIREPQGIGVERAAGWDAEVRVAGAAEVLHGREPGAAHDLKHRQA